MELFSNFFSELDFKVVVSDTYTLIAGFVAIGIPLSLQFAGQASDRYDNAILAKRLTTGRVVTPNTLIVLSILYIISGMLLKILFKEKSTVVDEQYQYILTAISMSLFFITIIFSAWFYLRFYYRILKTTDEYIPELLSINPSWLLDLVKGWNENKERIAFTQYINKFEFVRYVKRDYGQVSTGVEVLIEQIKNKPWDSSYKFMLSQFNMRMVKGYFGSYNKSSSRLNNTDIEFIKLYWDALLRIVRNARNDSNIEMSFKSQRYLSSLLTHIIHHPQYSEMIISNFDDEKNGIRWHTDIFEIARWQSHQRSEGIDLILECEWFGQISNVLAEPDARISFYGTNTAFECLYDVWGLIAKSCPEKILPAYKKITESLPSTYGHDEHFHSNDRGLKWLYSFFRDFYNNPVGMSDKYTIDEQLQALFNGKAYVQYGQFGESRPLTQIEYAEVLTKIDYEELYKETFLLSVKLYSLKLLATLALFERWNELGDCLGWRQPEGSKVTYCGNGFLPENANLLASALFDNYNYITNHHWFYDRHDLDSYVYRGSLYVLLLCFKKNKSLNSIYSGRNLSNIKIEKNILKGLLNQVKYIEVLKDNDLIEVEKILNINLENLEKIESKLVLTTPICQDKWFDYKMALIRGWNERAANKREGENILSLFSHSLSKHIQPISCKILNQLQEREQFLKGTYVVGNCEVFGLKAYDRFISCLYTELLKKAENQKSSEIEKLDNIVIFAPQPKLVEYGFKPTSKRQLLLYHPLHGNWVGVKSNDKRVLVVDNDSVSIILSVNGNGEDTSPLFSYLNDEGKEKSNIVAEIYFNIDVSNDSACFFLE